MRSKQKPDKIDTKYCSDEFLPLNPFVYWFRYWKSILLNLREAGFDLIYDKLYSQSILIFSTFFLSDFINIDNFV